MSSLRTGRSGNVEMRRILSVNPLPGYRIELAFDDGVHGVVDLSHLVGRGVFALWNDPQRFAQVHIGESGELTWDKQVDLCPDSLYLAVSALSFA